MKYFVILFIGTLIVSCNFSDASSSPTQVDMKKELIPKDYHPENNVEKLGIVLQNPATPKANYVHAVRSGNLIFLAGKGPSNSEGISIKGKLGADLEVKEGYQAARLVGERQLSVLKAELGNLNRVKRIIKVKGMVNAVPEFTDHSKVINGYSDLMVEVFGPRGKHARAAVGMASLPNNIAVEVEMIVEVFEE